MKWTSEKLTTLRACLASYPRRQMVDALNMASDLVGEPVSYEAAKGAFRAAGLGPPGSHCSDAKKSVDVDLSDLGEPAVVATEELERILVIPDCHHPSVDEVAWGVALNVGRRFKPHRIIVLGDFPDMHSTSRHAKDPNRCMLLEQEITAANKALDELDALGATHKHYLQGNHEENLERFLMEKAPALFNMVKLEELLRLKERGWTFTKYRQHLKIGKVFYVHDTGAAGSTAHIKSRDAFGGSVVQGHTHHAGASYAGTARGDAHVGIASGWLGKFDDAAYAHDIQKRRAWMHAFTLGWMEPDGVTHLQLVPIINGKACVNGQLIGAAALPSLPSQVLRDKRRY